LKNIRGPIILLILVFLDNYFYNVSTDTSLCLDGCNIHISSGWFDMSKKISKKDSAIRTISLAVGSLSLLVIAFAQLSDKELCARNINSMGNQIRLS